MELPGDKNEENEETSLNIAQKNKAARASKANHTVRTWFEYCVAVHIYPYGWLLAVKQR